ncbi:MAG: branched-chain amino acid ABC transporter permease [Desulfobacteraceae bacterium]|nr:MAG: branched-chain amino acid ABC transporter permease [Desulfobacteraceae bacterium]
MRRISGVFDTTYHLDMMVFRTTRHRIAMLLVMLFFLVLPLFSSPFWLAFLNTTAVTVIALQGLNILSGYCGQISIGHTAFMAVGAYSTAILSGRYGVPFWLCLPCSGLCAGLTGVLFGLPSLRIKGYYLALTTIAAQFIILYLIKNPFPEITGGAIALHVPDVTAGGFILETETHFYYLIMGATALMTFFAKSLLRSNVGRAFIAIRDNDIAAEAMGIGLYRHKLQAFFIGCFFAGVAGSVWAAYARVISPDDFTLTNSIWQMGMLIVGGLGSTLGPFFGALFIKLLNESCVVAGPFITSLVPQFGAQLSAALIEMSFGLTIVLFLVYEPRGIAHKWEILKESYRLWPFSY